MIKDICVEDVLDREPMVIDNKMIGDIIFGKKIMITGGSGSIGSEIVRQIAKFNPSQIILFDRNENNVFFLEKEMLAKHSNINILPRLGSITDLERVEAIFQETCPDIVFHTAANKHVPLSELNPSEAVYNNIYGTRLISEACEKYNTSVFVLISTDKAVKPTSVMGATKRLAEQCIQLISKNNSNTKFITVRFGNVLGSNGSVFPIFKSQIESGGPVKVTHPDMTRFFMTIPDAAKLVLESILIGKSGDLFILDMGEPVKILDLATRMIEAYGLKVGEDIGIEFSGVRPGEKIYEELIRDNEAIVKTSHPKINKIVTAQTDNNFLNSIIELENLNASTEPNIIRQHLSKLIPDAVLNG